MREKKIDEYTSEWYYDDGSLAGIYHYKDGKYHGVITTYYESGVVNRRTMYVDGHAHGLEEIWSEWGTLKSRAIWEKGTLVKRLYPVDITGDYIDNYNGYNGELNDTQREELLKKFNIINIKKNRKK